MSMNNIIVIKEFAIKGAFPDCNTPTIFGIFDISAGGGETDLDISQADEIFPDLRTAIRHAQLYEHEYGLYFILLDEE